MTPWFTSLQELHGGQEHPQGYVYGDDAEAAMQAVAAAYDALDLDPDADGFLAFRQPRALVFWSAVDHRHGQDCARA